MAPQQRTFTIVPNPLGMQGLVQRPAGEGGPAHRPMTSKQAQKLHRQATRLPKKTKAEQAKYEAEQRRLIKEEDEKRRASNKARMLREKKKEREQKIIESKKRKGLPIVDVHPSQDLITRFVRGNGTKKKRDVAGAALDTVREESPACDSATETAADEDVYHPSEEEPGGDVQVGTPTELRGPSSNPAKRLRMEPGDAGNPGARVTQSPRASQRADRTVISVLRKLDARSRESSLDVDDPAVEDLLRTQILADSVSAANSSALQRRSPADGANIILSPRLSPGKENNAPVSTAAIASGRSIKRSPMREPESAPAPPQSQSKQPPEGSVAGQKLLAIMSQGCEASQRSPAPPAPSMPQARHSSLKSRHACAPEQPSSPQHTRTSIREPSCYKADLIESMRTRIAADSAVGNTQGPMGHDMPRNCPEPCTLRVIANSKGLLAKSRHLGPIVKSNPPRESTASIPKTAANSSGPLVAVRPPAPAKPTPRVMSALGEHSMPPPPPPARRFKQPRQENTRQKFLPKHLQAPIPPRLLSLEAGRKPAPELESMAGEPTLPSSTQLFVLSHLDDILPSPSQELRELEETAPCPPPISRPRPPAWKSVPRFPARGGQPVRRAAPHPAPEFQAPQPREPTSAAPAAPPLRQAVEPALPFFSTQDLMLSSQDIRDLEDTTETPSKVPDQKTEGKTSDAATTPTGKEPASVAWKRPVDLFINPRSSRRATQDRSQRSTAIEEPRRLPQFSQAPRYAPRKSQPPTPLCSASVSARASQAQEAPSQASCLDPVRSNRAALSHLPPASRRSSRSSPLAHDAQRPCPGPAPMSIKAQTSEHRRESCSVAEGGRHTTEEPEQAPDKRQQRPSGAGHGQPAPAPLRTPKAAAGSPPRGRRFFTASNEAIQLAMEKSLRTHREEQRKREAEQRALELRLREDEEGRGRRRRRAQRQAQELRGRGQAEMVRDDAALLVWEAGKCGRRGGDGGDEVEVEESDSRWSGMAGDVPRRDHVPAADRRASHDARGATDEDLDAFDLDQDLEQALLSAEYDVVDVSTPVPLLPEHDHEGPRREARIVAASQETDYGDLDVTVEDLDEYL